MSKILSLMKALPRSLFIPTGMNPGSELSNGPISIGYNATMSAPYVHEFLLSRLEDRLQEGAKVLDIGCGTGYLAACMASLVGNKGCVVTVEHVPQLASYADIILSKCYNNTHVLQMDGRKGWGTYGKSLVDLYDVINVGGCVDESLLSRLAVDGVLVATVGTCIADQKTWLYTRGSNGINRTFLTSRFAFAPLTSLSYQLSDEFPSDPFKDT